MFNVGDTVGDYQIVSRIRSGGMATLYLGRRSGPAGFEREVALKVVHPHLANEPRYIEMFLDEARLAARIDHPNVVHIHDVGEAHGTLFLVMEYVQGVSLWQVERALDRVNRSIPIDLAVFVAIAVADGLHAAHETTAPDGHLLDVVHRDVSPQNVLIATRGHIKLIDFGIAKARGRLQETVGANLKGKIRYMAPEQALGRLVDRRTDVYSLGIVLWEMLTRQRFYASVDAMSLMEHVRAPTIIPPSQINPAVTPALDAVVLHALAIDPAERIATAYELRARLADAMPSALAIDASHMARFIAEVMQNDPVAQAEAQPLPDLASEPSPLAPPLVEAVAAPPLRPANTFGTPGAAFEIDTEQDSSPSPLVLPPVEISVPMPSSIRTVVLDAALPKPSFQWVRVALFAGLAVFAAGIGVTIGTRSHDPPLPAVAAAQSPAPALPSLTERVVVDPSPLPPPTPAVFPAPFAPERLMAAHDPPPATSGLPPLAALHPPPARATVPRPTVFQRPAAPLRPAAPVVFREPVAPIARPIAPIARPIAPVARPIAPVVPVARPIAPVAPIAPVVIAPTAIEPSRRPTVHGANNVPIVEADPF